MNRWFLILCSALPLFATCTYHKDASLFTLDKPSKTYMQRLDALYLHHDFSREAIQHAIDHPGNDLSWVVRFYASHDQKNCTAAMQSFNQLHSLLSLVEKSSLIRFDLADLLLQMKQYKPITTLLPISYVMQLDDTGLQRRALYYLALQHYFVTGETNRAFDIVAEDYTYTKKLKARRP